MNDYMSVTGKHIIIMLCIGLMIILTLSCLSLFDDSPKNNSLEVKKEIINDTVNNKDNVIILYDNITIYRNITNVINITNITNIINEINKTIEYKLNISRIQNHLILNIKPKKCYTIGCSKGFDLCKREILDILNWKKPKFSEAWATGYKSLLSKNISKNNFYKFNVYKDNYSEYIILNSSFWYVNHPINNSIYNNMLNNVSFNYTNINLVNKDEIILRRII